MQIKQRILLKDNIELFFIKIKIIFYCLGFCSLLPTNKLPECQKRITNLSKYYLKLFLVFVISRDDITIHGFHTFF